jgi:hypothetical protein
VAQRAADARPVLSGREVAALTLSSSSRRYPPLDPHFCGRTRTAAGILVKENWIFSRASRYCPDCLAGDTTPVQRELGGPWNLRWRLPITVACLTHRRILEHLCPTCHQPAQHTRPSADGLLRAPAHVGLHPAQCRNPHPHAPQSGDVCAARLGTPRQPATAATSSQLALQRGEVDVFAGSWVGQTPASGLYDGDLVVRLTQPANPTGPSRDPTVDVEMLLAHHGQWQRVGWWRGLDDTWPQLVAPTANAVMGLHTELVEAASRCDGISPAAAPPARMSSRGGLIGLLEAGLVTPGDEFVWDRRHHGVRHMVRVRADGALALADGRVYASPTAATTALGGVTQGGWTVFTRVSDGRTLAELRAEAHVRRKN